MDGQKGLFQFNFEKISNYFNVYKSKTKFN